jgi:hypothetical protein
MARFEHDLRVQLAERRNRLYRADFRIWENEAKLMLEWMRSEPYLAAMMVEIEAAPVDFQNWLSTGGLGHHGVHFPDNDRDRAKVCLALFEALDAPGARRAFSGAQNFNDQLRDFVEGAIDPLVHYLEDRIEDGGSVLGILGRYKRRTEWFHQSDLHARYEADTTHGEQVLDAHLREYLVDHGIDFPFSQPRSPSGEADVVSLGSDEPLALEIKLFLPDAGKDRAYIRQGFAQAYRYAADYHLPAGYLVTFNLTDGLLVFGSDHPERWPASITVGDRTVFCVTVDANPERPTASKDRKLARQELDREYLLEGLGTGP